MKYKEEEKKMGGGKFANMPTEVVMKEYPKRDYAMMEGLDDTITGIDETSRDSVNRVKKHRSKSMY